MHDTAQRRHHPLHLLQLVLDLEWKLVYVGSATSEAHDQVLDSILVGPVPVGVNKFIFEADAPKAELIPPHELLGVTVVLLSCSYKDREFIKIGYYCAVNYFQDEQYMAEPPPVVEWNKMYRNLLGERPKVTRYSIPWDNEEDMQVDRTGEDVEMIGDSQIGSVMSVDMQGASYMSMG